MSAQRYSYPFKPLRAASALAVGLAALVASAVAQQPQIDGETQQKLAELQQEMQSVQTELQTIEEQVMTDSELQQSREEYMDSLREAAIEGAPELRQTFERQEELVEELQGSEELAKPADARSPEFQSKLAEFQQLQSQVDPVVQEVAAKPELQQEFAELESAVVERMREVEPKTEELFAQRDQLVEEYRQLLSGLE